MDVNIHLSRAIIVHEDYLFCPADGGYEFPVIHVGEDRHSFERTGNIKV